MNTNPDDPNDSLHCALRAWEVKTPLPSRFQEQVWQRIAVAEAKGRFGWWHRFKDRLGLAFQRPALAVSYIAILLLVGLSVGYREADHRTTQAESQWRTLYVQSVDPYQKPRN